MATIASNPVLPSSSAPKGAASGKGASGDAADASGAPSDFMQLVSGMIEGNTPESQLPSNLMQLLLTGDTAGLEGLDTTDSDTTDSDDDESDEASALALSALLAALQGSLPAPVAGSAEGDNQGVGSIELNSSQKMMQALLSTSQGALAAALDSAAADGAGGGSAAGADGTSGAGSTNGAAGGASQTGAAHLQSLMQAHRAAESAPLAASSEVRTPVGAAGWGDEIGTHLAIMAANGRESASLRLSPEHLGPLEVQISVKDGQTNLVFGASNPDTRSALEQSLPRLREMFASQGLMLGDANVSRDAPRDAFRQQAPANSMRGSSDASSELNVNPITLRRLGLVDTYV